MDDAILVFDDACGFCTWWVRFVRERSDLRVVGFSALEGEAGEAEYGEVLERLPVNYEDCAYLLDGEDFYTCGAAMEEALVRSDLPGGLDLAGPVGFFRHFEDYNRTRETVYRWVAEHRGLLSHLMSANSVFRGDGEEGTDEEGGED